MVHLGNWFVADDRAHAVARAMSDNLLAYIGGRPPSGALLHLDWLGLSLWRWRPTTVRSMSGLASLLVTLPEFDSAAVVEIRRKGGAKLRSYDAVLTAVGTHLQTKFGTALTPTPSPAADPKKPAPTQPAASKVQQRVEMKRLAPQQPKAAGARTPMQSPGTRPKSPSEIVAEMRKARGFSN